MNRNNQSHWVGQFLLVLVLIPSLVSKIIPKPMEFVISSHVVCLCNGAPNYCVGRGRVDKHQRGSMEALIFHRNIIKTLCTSDECDQCCHQLV